MKVSSDHYCPPPSEIAQRYCFHTRARQAGETVVKYISELRSLTSCRYCNFGDSLEDMLRDRLVVGISNEGIQLQLLSEIGVLTFKKAFELAQNLEAAVKNTQDITDGASNDGSHPKLEGTFDLTDSIHKMADIVNRCSHCGDGNHTPFQCPFKSAKCHQCGKIGHIKRACCSRMSRPQESKPAQKKPISKVLPDSEEPISSVVSEEEHSD